MIGEEAGRVQFHGRQMLGAVIAGRSTNVSGGWTPATAPRLARRRPRPAWSGGERQLDPAGAQAGQLGRDRQWPSRPSAGTRLAARGRPGPRGERRRPARAAPASRSFARSSGRSGLRTRRARASISKVSSPSGGRPRRWSRPAAPAPRRRRRPSAWPGAPPAGPARRRAGARRGPRWQARPGPAG